MNYFKHKIRSQKPLVIAFWILFGIVAITALAFLLGFVLMSLWNALMPQIFGLPEVSYWQAVGLFLLSKILLGGFSGGSKNKKNSSNKCGSKRKKESSDFSKWELYDQFWQEEGDAAYQEFIRKSSDNHTSDEQYNS